MKVKVPSRVDGFWEEDIDNIPLRILIEGRLNGISLEDYIQSILRKTCLSIGKNIEKVSDFQVDIFYSVHPKTGCAFKSASMIRERDGQDFPDMKVGFSGDLIEFEKTIIHETLHCLRWDEEMVEKKTQEIWSEKDPETYCVSGLP